MGVALVKVANGDYRVAIQPDNTFEPMHGRVPVGATVEWQNSGGIHDITDADHSPPLWSSDDRDANRTKLRFGDVYAHTFAVAGTFHYTCTIHAGMGMTGTITVG